MGEAKVASGYKFTSGNICCFGVSHVGVPVATILAHMCYSRSVSVIDLNAEKILHWNTKQVWIREPKVEEMLKLSQNRNLVFSSDIVKAVKEALLIFILIDSPLHVRGFGEGKRLNLSGIETAVRIIAKESEEDKIIILKGTEPVGTNEAVQRILRANKQNHVDFQVLSMPEFFSAGNAISDLLHPGKVLIGSDLSVNALNATEILKSIYSSWVPRNKFLSLESKSVELAKIGENALLAERLSDVSALMITCDKSGADITDVLKMIGKNSDIGSDYLEPSLGFGGTLLKKDLVYLIHLCEDLNLHETADYWNQVLLMNEYLEKRFYKKILASFFNTLVHRKIAILGLSFKKNLEATNDLVAIDVCLSLAKEGAKLYLYDPKMDSRQSFSELKAKGMTDTKNVTYVKDPYGAARKTDAIIFLTDRDELRSLDFNLIYKDMLKPAHIFDSKGCLPREALTKIGFVVQTIGKECKSQNIFQIFENEKCLSCDSGKSSV